MTNAAPDTHRTRMGPRAFDGQQELWYDVEKNNRPGQEDSMTNQPQNLKELLDRRVSGFHQYCLSEPYRPTYLSGNLCGMLGFSAEELLSETEDRYAQQVHPADRQRYDAFLKQLAAEARTMTLEYRIRRKDGSTVYVSDTMTSYRCHVMLYNLDAREPEPAEPVVRIRTFSYFDIFVNDKPIAFRNEKSKELFALLVDRRGGFVSSEEAIGFLWEDEPANSVTLARYRKVALRLKNLLEEYGVPEVVESVNGKRRIATEKVRCDLYDYLSGREEYAQLFKGSYLTNYSWGETTLAERAGDHLYGAG